MQIKTLQLKDFKCFDVKVLSLGTQVEIVGRNGSGKSSIRESILFALYHRTDATARDTDKYIKNDAEFCEIEIDTDLGKVKRQRGKHNSKLWLDGEETTHENLMDKLKLPRFEIFNSVFTAGYFMTLDYKDQRDIILSLTESVDIESIYKKLGGTTSIDLGDIDKTYKEFNKEKSKLKTTIDTRNITIELCGFSKEMIEKIQKDNEEADEKLVRVGNLLDILKKIPIEEAKIKLEDINKKLEEFIPGGKIEVLEILKTGMGYKDVFKLYVNDKEYKYLSTGEKKITDIGLCRFLNEFYKLNMIFVDNMESISDQLDIDMPQVFTSKVTQDNLHVQII